MFKSAAQLAQLHTLAEGGLRSRLSSAKLSRASRQRTRATQFASTPRAPRCISQDTRTDEWQRDSERTTSIARSHGDPTLIALALTSYGVGARKVGRFGLALASFREAVEVGRPYGALYIVTFARLVHLNVLYLTGDLAGSRNELLAVLAELPESVTLRILIAQFGIALSIALRDETLFRRCYSADVLEAAFSTNEPIQYAPLAATIAEYHLAGGEGQAAGALLERMLAALPDGWDDCEVLLPVAVCCAQADLERARARFDIHGARTRNPFFEACRELFDAYAAARFGGREAKLRHAKAAVRLLQRLGMPLLEAEAYELAEQPTRSVALCETIGALRLPRRLGPQSRRRAVATHLTAREREVVELALSSLSNGAIADELSLSERTVEAHLAAAYRKLGVRSRGELLNVLGRR